MSQVSNDVLEERIRNLTEKVDMLAESVAEISSFVTKWKAGAGALLGLGALLGWFSDRITAVWDVLKH